MVPSLNQSLSNDETAVVQPPPSYEIDPPTSDEDGTSTVRGPRGFPGLSAYEVWVQNGGQGSPATYLASLVGPRGKSTALFVKDFIRDLSDPLSVAEGFNIAFGTAQASAVAEVVAAPGIYGMMLNVANLPGQIRLTIMEGAYLQTTDTTGCFFKAVNSPNIRVDNEGEFNAPSAAVQAFVIEASPNGEINQPVVKGCSIGRIANSDNFLVTRPTGESPSAFLDKLGIACLEFHFCRGMRVEHPRINGYSNGIHVYGGDPNALDPQSQTRSSTPLTADRGCKDLTIVGGRLWNAKGSGFWATMTDGIVIQGLRSDTNGEEGIGLHGCLNARIDKAILRNCRMGNLRLAHANDNIEVIDTKLSIASNDFKLFCVTGGIGTASGRLTLSNVEMTCETGIAQAGYETAGFTDLRIEGLDLNNVAFRSAIGKLSTLPDRFGNTTGILVGGNRQSIENLVSINTTQIAYDHLIVGQLRTVDGRAPELYMERNRFLNVSVLGGGTAITIFHDGLTSKAAKAHLMRNETSGFAIDVRIYQSGQSNPNLAPLVYLEDNTFGAGNILSDPITEAGQVAARVYWQNNRQSPDVLVGPGVVSKTATTIDLTNWKAGDRIIAGFDGAIRPGSAAANGGRVLINDYVEIPNDAVNDRWLYLGSLVGSAVDTNKQTMGLSIRALPYLSMSEAYQHDLRIGSRGVFDAQQGFYGLSTLDDRVTAVCGYAIGNDGDAEQYRVYLRINAGAHCVRVFFDEFVDPLFIEPFLSVRTSAPAGVKVFDSSDSVPQLWVPKGGFQGGGGDGSANLGNYFTKAETYSKLSLDNAIRTKADSDFVETLAEANDKIVDPDKGFRLIFVEGEDTLYVKTLTSIQPVTYAAPSVE